MPEEPYFRQPEVQKMLADILFVYCKEDKDIGYRQGMHELLATVLWVVQEDALSSLDSVDDPSLDDNQRLMMKVLNGRFIEHDSFTLFNLIMQNAKSFYEVGGSGRGDAAHGYSPIIERSKQIHEVLLAQLDPELSLHLTQIEILPQIFLM